MPDEPVDETQAAPFGADGETLVYPGGAVKALGDGRVGGYLVLFSTKDDPDLQREYYTPETDFWLDADGRGKSVVIYDHTLDPTIKGRRIGDGTLEKRDVGVWIEAQLARRDNYEKAIHELVGKGKLGWSSGTAGHLVEYEQTGKSRRIATWPLGIDASLTTAPVEPRTRAVTLKSLAAAKASGARPDPLDDENTGPHVASAALRRLNDIHQMHVHGTLYDRERTAEAKSEALGPHFDLYRDRSMKAIAALLNDPGDADGAKSAALALDFLGKAMAGLPLSTHSETVLAAAEGLSARMAELLALRERSGRSLSSERRAQIKGLSDTLAVLLARAESAASPAPSPSEAARARLRSLQIKSIHNRAALRGASHGART